MEKILNSPIKADFYDKLSYSKTEFNWNKNPIKMDLFLYFLKVPVILSTSHLGYDNGWTLLKNKEMALTLHGGIIAGVHYLNNIEFGERLCNKYNNYVNPFYLFEILSEEGQKFFLNYYKEDIEKMISDLEKSIEYSKDIVKEKEVLHSLIINEIKTLTPNKYLKQMETTIATTEVPGTGLQVVVPVRGFGSRSN